MTTDAQVLIAGGGPVGLAAALALARQDIPVTVLEKGDGPGTASRASTLHPPSLEFLAELELIDVVQEQGLHAPAFQHRDRTDGVIAEFDLGILADDTAFPYRVQLEQDKLCLILRDHLSIHDHATFLTGQRVVGASQSGDHVEVVTDTADGRVTHRGSWLIGADGAYSAVREAFDIEAEGFTYPQQFLVISTTAPLHELIPDLAHVNYVSDPDEWCVLLRTPDHWRVLFPVDADAVHDQVVDDAAIQARLQGLVPMDGPWPVISRSHYEIQQRVASRFRDGRVLLAGDAAHLNNPLGGLGMNTGLQDAWSLSRRLADLWHGRAGDDTLDEYATLRREVARDVVDRDTQANLRRMEASDEASRLAHHAELRALVADPVALRAHLRRITLLDAARTHV